MQVYWSLRCYLECYTINTMMLCQMPIYINSGIHNAHAVSEPVRAMALATVLHKSSALSPYCNYPTSPITPLGKTRHSHLSHTSHWNLTFKSLCSGRGYAMLSATTAMYRSRGSGSITYAYGLQLSSTTLDMGCTALIMSGAYGLVSAFDFLTKRNVLDQLTGVPSEQKLSRKFVHILSGLLFMLAWPLFSSSADARYIAAIVPIANCARLLVYGFSFATNEGLVKAVSREGKPEELLRGPMYYVMVLIFCTTVFWRESPIGMVALAMMCGGDGIADIMGRRFGGLKLPYNHEKSWAGSISMFVFGFLISLGVLSYFSAFGFIQLDWETIVKNIAIVSMAATIVESLPVTQVLDDNISVPITSILVGLWLFQT